MFSYGSFACGLASQSFLLDIWIMYDVQEMQTQIPIHVIVYSLIQKAMLRMIFKTTKGLVNN